MITYQLGCVWLHTESGIITSSAMKNYRAYLLTKSVQALRGRGHAPPPPLTVCTHFRRILGCPGCEIWRQDGFNFIYCIRSEKTSISTMSVVGIFFYIRSTLPERRKANPWFTNSPFNVIHVSPMFYSMEQLT